MRHKDDDNDEQSVNESDLPELVGEAISEILSDVEIQLEPEERVVLAKQLIEEFSPLMMTKGAGATSSVSVTMNPGGGVESARSVKARNAIVNLKQAAVALPATLPAFATFYLKHGISDTVGTSAVAILYLFGLLKPISEILQVPLTKQAAGVLKVMWTSRNANEDLANYDGLLESVNATFREYQWKQITPEELVSYLEVLEKIGCIERDGSRTSIAIENIRWRLTETVRVSY